MSRESEIQFLKKHSDAHEIVTDLDGKVVMAVYQSTNRNGHFDPIKTVYCYSEEKDFPDAV